MVELILFVVFVGGVLYVASSRRPAQDIQDITDYDNFDKRRATQDEREAFEEYHKERIQEAIRQKSIEVFTEELAKANLPTDLFRVLVRLYQKHTPPADEDILMRFMPVNLDNPIIKKLGYNYEPAIKWGVEFATLHAKRVKNQIETYLPPVEMIRVGGTKTWSSYAHEFWASPAGKDLEKHYSRYYALRFTYETPDVYETELRKVCIALKLPDDLRTQAHMIMAPPGHGKTNYMENLIMDDVATGAAVIVMDSQEGMLNRLLKALPEDRVAYFDGAALHRPLAISAFNLGRTDRPKDEARIERSFDLFENMFSSMDFAFTTPQQTLFRELCRFLVVIPNSGLHTALSILQDGYTEYYAHLYKVPEETREFITTHLGPIKQGRRVSAGYYSETRKSVEGRIRAIGSSPAIRRMFNAPVQKVNIGKEIASHKIILINTAQSALSPSGASLLGRFFLMQIALLVLSRPETADPKQRVCFYIDEAQEYFSNSKLLSLMLEQGRKRGLCMTMAFHHLGQLARAGDGLPDVMRSLTAIKSVKASTAPDGRAMASDMQRDPGELQNVRKRHFMVYGRDVGSGLFRIANSQEKLKPRRKSLKGLKARMHEKYGYDPKSVVTPKTEKPSPKHTKATDPEPDITLDDKPFDEN